MNKIFFICTFLFCNFALAYPEMIRHGYTSCTSCHVSPSGGGITSAYGRSISKELLSRWAYEGEEQIVHGAIKNENVRSWIDGSRERGFNVSGNFRFLQTRIETAQVEQGRGFPMQRDLELAGKFDQWNAVASYGFRYDPRASDEVELRRAYLLYNVNENISLRAGRFLPIFGIMFSDHYLAIKQGLQLGQFTERDSAEMNFIFEKWSAHLSYSKAPESKRNLQEEEAVTAGFNYNLTETSRVGLNYWFGDFLGKKRDITGINALLGYSKSFYSLTEFDLQSQQPDFGNETKGYSYFHRFGYEATRGLHFIAQVDGSKNNKEDPNTQFYSFGAGITVFPRPHWEAQVLLSRPKYKGQEFVDSAFLVIHYYL